MAHSPHVVFKGDVTGNAVKSVSANAARRVRDQGSGRGSVRLRSHQTGVVPTQAQVGLLADVFRKSSLSSLAVMPSREKVRGNQRTTGFNAVIHDAQGITSEEKCMPLLSHHDLGW